MAEPTSFNNYSLEFTEELVYPESTSQSETSDCETSDSETNESEESVEKQLSGILDISGLKPYDFEPEIPFVEEEVNEESKKTTRVGNVDWCTCRECKAMDTDTESLCCLDTNEVPDEHFEGK